MTKKPILCLDFDGVIHSYTSGWKGIDKIPDKIVPGALEFMKEASEHFHIYIYSSRSSEPLGICAMQAWLSIELYNAGMADEDWTKEIQFPDKKPPAKVSIDDRAITFDGSWPSIELLRRFKPWNMR